MTRPPRYVGGPRCGEAYPRPVGPQETLVIAEGTADAQGDKTSLALYVLRRPPNGPPVLAYVDPSPQRRAA